MQQSVPVIRGFSLLELMVVLVISAGILVASTTLVSQYLIAIKRQLTIRKAQDNVLLSISLLRKHLRWLGANVCVKNTVQEIFTECLKAPTAVVKGWSVRQGEQSPPTLPKFLQHQSIAGNDVLLTQQLTTQNKKESTAFYIGWTKQRRQHGRVPALFYTDGHQHQALVEGVNHLQFRYGLCNLSSAASALYRASDIHDWTRVCWIEVTVSQTVPSQSQVMLRTFIALRAMIYSASLKKISERFAAKRNIE